MPQKGDGVSLRIESSLLEKRTIQLHCNACLSDHDIKLDSLRCEIGLFNSMDGEEFIIVTCKHCQEATTFFFSDYKDSELFREFRRVIDNDRVMCGGKAPTIRELLFMAKRGT